jgi:hypothetical protein
VRRKRFMGSLDRGNREDGFDHTPGRGRAGQLRARPERRATVSGGPRQAARKPASPGAPRHRGANRGGRPLRGRSSNAFSRSLRKRTPHLRTMRRPRPTSRATADTGIPAESSKIVRARTIIRCGAVTERHRSRSSLSPLLLLDSIRRSGCHVPPFHTDALGRGNFSADHQLAGRCT